MKKIILLILLFGVICFLFIGYFIFFAPTQKLIPVETSFSPPHISNHFGVDGASVSYLSEIAKLNDGVTGVNSIKWGLLEPNPPVASSPQYSVPAFNKLTELMNEVSKNGRVAQMNILFTNNWAMDYSNISSTDPVNGAANKRLKAVKNEYLAEWGVFIKKIVTAYPQIAFLQIGSEEENAWADSNGYITALCVAYTAAHEINPDIKILAAGFNLGDVFALSESEQNDIMKSASGTKLIFIQDVIKNGKGCFDVLTIHPSGREKSITPMLQWYKQEFLKNGYSRPIWSDDTASGLGVGGTKPLQGEENIFLLIENDTLRQNLPAYSQFMAIQSELLVKKSIVLFASGVERVILSSDADFDKYFINAWHYLGLIDTTDSIKKPAYYTYAMEIKLLDNFTSVQEVQSQVYQFTLVNRKKVYVAWAETPQVIDLSDDINGPVLLQHIVTQLDSKKEPVFPVSESVLSKEIPLTNEPVFIIPQ